MWKIIKYSIADLIRSRWSYIYFAFYLLVGFTLLFLSSDLSDAILTIMNIVIIIVPLIGSLFGIMYFYNSREFIELLLSMPIKRTTIFIGQYLGLAISLSSSLILGLGIPFLFYGIFSDASIFEFLSLLMIGTFLTFIFSGISYNIGLRCDNKIKGFGLTILVWLLLAVIYDGIFLIILNVFGDYPLEKFSLIISISNPIDLARIMLLLKLDVSALLGYTGAVFKEFFGSSKGSFISFLILCIWTFFLFTILHRKSHNKDF